MRWLPTLAALAALTAVASARPVRGVVVHAGVPVADATVTTEHGDMAITSADGTFALEVPDDALAVTVYAPGLATRTIAVAGAALTVELVAAGSGDASEVIEITSAAPPPREPLAYRLTADEIRQLPGAANDALRAIAVLPGAARIPFGLGGLALRGTSPRDTAVYLDGIEVPLAFHFGGVTAFYPSAMLADLAVLSSGFDAGYGRAAGGVVALASREPRRDRLRVGGHLGLFDSQAFVEGPAPGGGGVIASVRRSYLDVVAGPFLPDHSLPSYWDFQVRTGWGERDRIAPMVFGSIDQLDSGSDDLTMAFVRGAVPIRHRAGRTTISAVPWAGWERVELARDEGFSFKRRFARPSTPVGIRAEITRDTTWGAMRSGGEVIHTWLSRAQQNFTGASGGPMLTDGAAALAWTDAAAWADGRWETARLLVRAGGRIDRYGLTNEVVADPRIAIEVKLDGGVTLRQAAGRYHQPPTAGEVDPIDGTPGLPSSYYDQAVLGLEAALPANTAVSATGFASRGHRLAVGGNAASPSLVDFDLGSFGPTLELLLEKQLGLPSARAPIGRARAHGLEIAARHASAWWSALVGYTYARSERRDQPFLEWRPFELDQRHKLDVVGSVNLGAWQLGARLTAVSGMPYNATDQALLIPRQLPAFVELDVRVARRWHRTWGDVVAYLDLHNATNRANVEGRYQDPVTYRETDRHGLPILPFLGIELVPPP